MTASDVIERKTEATLSQQKAIAEALSILNAPYSSTLPTEEIISRVQAVYKLMKFEIPFEQRRELDRALMRIAMREPNTSNEVRAIIRQIFKAMAPTSGPGLPQRDAQGRIIPRIRPELSLPTEEDIARWDAEYEKEQDGC